MSKPGAVRNFSWLRAWPVIALSACKNGSPNDSDMNKHFNEPSTVLKHWSESVRSGCILGARGTVKGRAGTSMPHAKHRSGQRRSPNSDQPPLRPRRPDRPPEDHVPPGDHDQSASQSTDDFNARPPCFPQILVWIQDDVQNVFKSTGGFLKYWRNSEARRLCFPHVLAGFMRTAKMLSPKYWRKSGCSMLKAGPSVGIYNEACQRPVRAQNMHHLTAGAASRRCFSAGIPRRHYLILSTPAKLPTSEPIVDHTFDTVLIERSLLLNVGWRAKNYTTVLLQLTCLCWKFMCTGRGVGHLRECGETHLCVQVRRSRHMP